MLAIAGFLCAYVLVSAIARYTAIEMPGKPYGYGANLIQRYDIAGILYRDSEAPLDEFSKWPEFDRGRYVAFVGRAYSPQRLDFLDLGGPFHFGEERGGVVKRQWRSLVAARPLTIPGRASLFEQSVLQKCRGIGAARPISRRRHVYSLGEAVLRELKAACTKRERLYCVSSKIFCYG